MLHCCGPEQPHHLLILNLQAQWLPTQCSQHPHSVAGRLEPLGGRPPVRAQPDCHLMRHSVLHTQHQRSGGVARPNSILCSRRRACVMDEGSCLLEGGRTSQALGRNSRLAQKVLCGSLSATRGASARSSACGFSTLWQVATTASRYWRTVCVQALLRRRTGYIDPAAASPARRRVCAAGATCGTA